MLARATFRAASAPSLVARRGFQSTRAQLSSPYHYPEGPRSNLPFDPLKKGFAFKYWGFMGKPVTLPMGIAVKLTGTATGFALPFLLAGEILIPIPSFWDSFLTAASSQSGRRRRTSRKRDEIENVHWSRVPGKRGTCRLSGGPVNNCTRHQSINFIVPVHSMLFELAYLRRAPGQ